MKYCKVCGCVLSNKETFCSNCGSKSYENERLSNSSSSQSDTKYDTNHQKDATVKRQLQKFKKQINTQTLIAVSCVATIIITLCLTMFIINYNSKQQERLSAIERIDSICDELNMLESIPNDENYYKAKNKLDEIKNLLDKHNISDGSLEKYNDVSNYIEDLKTYNEMRELLFTDKESALSEFHSKVSGLKTERVKSRIDGHINYLTTQAMNVLLTHSFYSAQQACIADYPGCQIEDTMYFVEDGDYIPDAKWDGADSINRLIISDTDTIVQPDIGVVRFLGPDFLTKIHENGGRAIIVNYKLDGKSWYRWFSVGFDVEGYYDNSSIKYKITCYEQGEGTEYTVEFDQLKEYALKAS